MHWNKNWWGFRRICASFEEWKKCVSTSGGVLSPYHYRTCYKCIRGGYEWLMEQQRKTDAVRIYKYIRKYTYEYQWIGGRLHYARWASTWITIRRLTSRLLRSLVGNAMSTVDITYRHWLLHYYWGMRLHSLNRKFLPLTRMYIQNYCFSSLVGKKKVLLLC